MSSCTRIQFYQWEDETSGADHVGNTLHTHYQFRKINWASTSHRLWSLLIPFPSIPSSAIVHSAAAAAGWLAGVVGR